MQNHLLGLRKVERVDIVGDYLLLMLVGQRSSATASMCIFGIVKLQSRQLRQVVRPGVNPPSMTSVRKMVMLPHTSEFQSAFTRRNLNQAYLGHPSTRSNFQALVLCLRKSFFVSRI